MTVHVLAREADPDDFLRTRYGCPVTMLLNACIPGEPRPKGRPRVVRGRAVTPVRTQEAETALRWALRSVLRGQAPVADLRIGVELAFYCASGHHADLDNLVKLVLDAANGFVWEDDSQVVHIEASVCRETDEPRTLFRAWTL